MQRLQLISLFLSAALAGPTPQTGGSRIASCVHGTAQTKYTVEKQEKVTGDVITGDYTVSGGDSLTDSSTFASGVTVTVGGTLGLSEIASVGLTATVASTETKSTTQGANIECPEGPWKCALAIYPELLEVSGQQEQKNKYIKTCDKNFPEPYTARFPVEGDSGGIRSRVEVCACKNFDHWGDQGSPEIKCDGCAL